MQSAVLKVSSTSVVIYISVIKFAKGKFRRNRQVYSARMDVKLMIDNAFLIANVLAVNIFNKCLFTIIVVCN